jgi:hypothetical protein
MNRPKVTNKDIYRMESEVCYKKITRMINH